MAAFSDLYRSLPASIQAVVQKVIEEIEPDQIILFGSRARGDYRENSDFDLAVKAEQIDPKAWTELLLEISEGSLTLYKIDLVRYDQMSADYQSRVDLEGKPLYVRS